MFSLDIAGKFQGFETSFHLHKLAKIVLSCNWQTQGICHNKIHTFSSLHYNRAKSLGNLEAMFITGYFALGLCTTIDEL
jgi:hypothetical protein